MAFQITGLYASALGILAIVLTVLVIRHRVKSGISLRDGDNPAMIERIRRHGNFMEFVPLALLLLAMAEAGGASKGWMHGLGGLLLAARLIHPFGIRHGVSKAPARIAGALGTMLVIVLASALIAWQRLV